MGIKKQRLYLGELHTLSVSDMTSLVNYSIISDWHIFCFQETTKHNLSRIRYMFNCWFKLSQSIKSNTLLTLQKISRAHSIFNIIHEFIVEWMNCSRCWLTMIKFIKFMLVTIENITFFYKWNNSKILDIFVGILIGQIR